MPIVSAGRVPAAVLLAALLLTGAAAAPVHAAGVAGTGAADRATAVAARGLTADGGHADPVLLGGFGTLMSGLALLLVIVVRADPRPARRGRHRGERRRWDGARGGR